jgi:hypothetical protein
MLPSALPTSHAPVVHFDAVEDAVAGLLVFVDDVPFVTLVELPVPVPEPSPVVVVVLVLVVVLLLDDAGFWVVLVVLVELFALDDDDAGAFEAVEELVTHLPLIGSQYVFEPSAFDVSDTDGSGWVAVPTVPEHTDPVMASEPLLSPPSISVS